MVLKKIILKNMWIRASLSPSMTLNLYSTVLSFFPPRLKVYPTPSTQFIFPRSSLVGLARSGPSLRPNSRRSLHFNETRHCGRQGLRAPCSSHTRAGGGRLWWRWPRGREVEDLSEDNVGDVRNCQKWKISLSSRYANSRKPPHQTSFLLLASSFTHSLL